MMKCKPLPHVVEWLIGDTAFIAARFAILEHAAEFVRIHGTNYRLQQPKCKGAK